MKRLPLLFLLIGLFCFFWLVHSISLSVLFANLKLIGWGVLLVIIVELVGDVLTTRGWWLTFAHEARIVPFPTLYGMRLAGAVVNAVTPTAMIGGEVLKALLLRRYLPVADSFASVIAAKVSLLLGHLLFVLVGIVAFFHQLTLPPSVKQSLVAVFVLTLLGGIWLCYAQRNGLFARIFAVADRWGISSSVLAGVRVHVATIDAKLVDLYVSRGKDFAVSVFFHFLAQGLGALQIFLILSWLAVPADFLTCVAVETFSLLIDGLMFFVPGQVGVQEGGKVVIFSALGFTAATGFTVGVALRLNQIALILLGLAALAALNASRATVGSAADERRPVLDG